MKVYRLALVSAVVVLAISAVVFTAENITGLAPLRTANIDWNFASTDDLFAAITERTDYMYSVGKMPADQYNAMLSALAVLREGIDKRCVSEQDVRIALRVLGGANRGEKFSEQYDIAVQCLKAQAKTPAKVEIKSVVNPPTNYYAGEYSIQPFGKLVISGFSGTLSLDKDYRVSVEVVQDGFNVVGDSIQLRVNRDLSGTLNQQGILTDVSLAEV